MLKQIASAQPDLLSGLVPPNYLNQGVSGLNSRNNLVRVLLSQRSLPKEPWDDLSIEAFLEEIAMMDANNFPGNVGVGEREGRVFANLVRKRNFFLSHGIGRSGDIVAPQPKAAGSSLLARLTDQLLLSALKLSGFSRIHDCVVLPLATGMSLLLCLLTLKQRHSNPSAKYVIVPRIDQKTCLKCVYSAGLTPIVVENELCGDELRTDLAAIKKAILSINPRISNSVSSSSLPLDSNAASSSPTSNPESELENLKVCCSEIVCIMSTTSCFAPRTPDRVFEISRLCASLSLAHVINNAYGIQDMETCRLIDKSSDHGRVDFCVSSLDKNFMVPVGGAVVYTFRPPKQSPTEKQQISAATTNHIEVETKAQCSLGTQPSSSSSLTSAPQTMSSTLKPQQSSLIDSLSALYPGRASAAAHIDLFITLVSMGEKHWLALLKQQATVFALARTKLQVLATEFGERLLETPNNRISLAMTLKTFQSAPVSVSLLGSMLFSRNVSGPRVVAATGKTTSICETAFLNYGCHVAEAQAQQHLLPYLNVAVAIGMTEQELDESLTRIKKCLKELKKKQQPKQPQE